MKKSNKIDFPFDQYSRLFQVSTVINNLRNVDESYKILDVGGYGGRTGKFFPNDTITTLDVFDVSEPGYIKGSGADLPFEDNAFDFVVSFDVLEHVPNNERNKFIKEGARCARKAFICAAPFSSEYNGLAEIELNEFNRKLYKEDHRWLKEHIDNGLPASNLVEKRLVEYGLSTIALGSNEVVMWMLMQGSLFLNSKYNLSPQLMVDLNLFYNSCYQLSDGSPRIEENYRKIVYGFKDNKDLELTKGLFAGQGINAKDKVRLIGKMLNFYESLISLYNDKNQVLQNQLLDRDNTIEELSKELTAIKKSRSYLLAKKMANARHIAGEYKHKLN